MYEDLLARAKTNLDLLLLKDDSLQDAADLPAPDVPAPWQPENGAQAPAV